MNMVIYSIRRKTARKPVGHGVTFSPVSIHVLNRPAEKILKDALVRHNDYDPEFHVVHWTEFNRPAHIFGNYLKARLMSLVRRNGYGK